jgi:hypothetical protein
VLLAFLYRFFKLHQNNAPKKEHGSFHRSFREEQATSASLLRSCSHLVRRRARNSGALSDGTSEVGGARDAGYERKVECPDIPSVRNEAPHTTYGCLRIRAMKPPGSLWTRSCGQPATAPTHIPRNAVSHRLSVWTSRGVRVSNARSARRPRSCCQQWGYILGLLLVFSPSVQGRSGCGLEFCNDE